MATYIQWNNAIVRYFTANVTRGSSVFLTVNDDALREIAANFLADKVALEDAADDFLTAVRTYIVLEGKVELITVAAPEEFDQPPRGVAFLGLMVLAAHRMNGEQEIDASAYFIRLNKQLGFPSRSGRVSGLEIHRGIAPEEKLWIDWNRWLQRNGWQPTARQGSEGARKFLNYVLSQALVRDDDKEFLLNRFRQNLGAGGVKKDMDEVQLAGWLQRTSAISRRYLREGFRNSDPRRAAAFYEAAYRVFEATNWLDGTAPRDIHKSRIINAGLFRSVSLSGQVHYRMFVPQPTNWIPKPLTLQPATGSDVRLVPWRPGHFQPLAPQPPFVSDTSYFSLHGDPLFDAVVFPKRDFWILTPDPEDPTGVLATWEKFPNLLGQKFTLLCSTEGNQLVQEEMEKFHDAKLLDWDNGPHSLPNMPLHEYRGCMILSSGWEGVVPSEQCIGLFEALRPKQFAAISLSGGIRAPGQNAWLVGNPPEAILYGFEERFDLRLLSGNEEKLACSQKRQQPLRLESGLEAGIYTLEAEWNGQLLATRSFRLISWEEMDAARPENEYDHSIVTPAGTLSISGALLQEPTKGKVVHNV